MKYVIHLKYELMMVKWINNKTKKTDKTITKVIKWIIKQYFIMLRW